MLLNIMVVSWSLGIFLAFSFVLCVLYGLVVPQKLHGMQNFLDAELEKMHEKMDGLQKKMQDMGK